MTSSIDRYRRIKNFRRAERFFHVVRWEKARQEWIEKTSGEENGNEKLEKQANQQDVLA